MPYADPKRKNQRQAERSRGRRRAWIETNGPCAVCGSTDELEIDHVDPAQKEYRAGWLWSRRKEIRDAELAKCQVLCHLCHLAKTHKGQGGHGTTSEYKKGCRCEKCRAGRAALVRDWRRRKAQEASA